MAPETDKYRHRLRDLVPIENLSQDLQDKLFAGGEVLQVGQGKYVFREGDTDDYNYYLLEGELEMSANGAVANRYVGGSDTCRYPLAQLRPRKFSARVARNAVVFRVDRHLVDELLQRQSAGGAGAIEVGEEPEESGDWMTSMLQSELFSRIPATNLQRLFAAVDYTEVHAGDEIITQGDPGDYYYIIHHGTCDVLVEPASGGKQVKVASLKDNDSFGEEALVTDAPRNATIRMTSNGHLLRLGKQDFQSLIRDVLLESVSFEKAERMVAEGARWLDVRFTEDHEQVAIPDTLNIPFNVLRLRADELDPNVRYITYCNNGLRSSVAAFLLIQRGFDVCFLDHGLQNSPLAPQLAGEDQPVTPAPAPATPPPAPEPAAEAPAAPPSAAPAPSQAEELLHLREELSKARAQLEQAVRMKREADVSRKSFEKMVEQKFQLAKQKIRDEMTKAARAQEEAARLGRELEAARSEVAEEDKLRQLAEDHARQLEAQRGTLEAQFQEELKSARAEWEEKETRLGAEGEALQGELEQLRDELARLRAQAEAELEAARDQGRDALEQQRATFAAELDDLNARLAAAEDESRRLAEELETARSGSVSEHATVERLGAERDQAAAERDRLQGELEALQADTSEELERLSAERDDIAAARERLEVELQGLQAARAEDREVVERLSRERDEQAAAVDAAEGRVTELEQAHARQAEELASLRAGQAEEGEALERTRRERDEATATLEALRAELGELRQSNAGLENDLAERERHLAAADEQRAALAEDLDTARGRAETLESANADLTAAREALAARVEALEQDLAAAREGGDEAARLAQQRAEEATEALEAARRAWDEERAGLEAELSEARSVLEDFDTLRQEMEEGRRAVEEAAERQEQELSALEQTLRREAEEALSSERERLEREFEERLAAARREWQAEVGVDTAGDVADFLAQNDRTAVLETQLENAQQQLGRLRDALKAAEKARDEAVDKLRQSRQSPPLEEVPDDENRLVDPAKIRELMERRRELLKRQSDKKG